VYNQAVGTEQKSATLSYIESCALMILAPEAALEPKNEDIVNTEDTRKKNAKLLQLQVTRTSNQSKDKLKDEDPKHLASTNTNEKYVPFMYAREITRIAEAWELLSEEERRQITDIVDRALSLKQP